MKNLLFFAALFAAVTFMSCSDDYDDSALKGRVGDLENRVAKLEELCKQMNTNISSLQAIVTALQNNDYVTGVTPIIQNGKELGYTITFSKSKPIVIYHGKDGENGKDGIDGTDGKDGENGKDGQDGTTPTIGVKKDTDGIYYWTLNGDWLTDAQGNKIKAEGTNGKDGADGADGADGNDGQDGSDGTNGKDGVTPKFKIVNEYWFISYDNGSTWTQLGKATGDDGKDGENASCESIFKDVTQDEKYVYFELIDGSVITIPKSNQAEVGDSKIINFEDENVKKICVRNWDTNHDGELSYGEAAQVTSIRKFFRGTTIQSFHELQFFTGIDEIGNDAFRLCENLSSITIPESVFWIEEYAFASCSKLETIVIPNNVTWIGQGAFSGCGLTSIVIGNGVSVIGNDSFYNCRKLMSVFIPDNVTKIGLSAFGGCDNLKEIILSSSLSLISGNTFFGCANLSKIVIPYGIYTIGNNAFYGCNNLTDITIPNSVTSIGNNAFYGCNNLTDITIPNSVTSIGNNAFEGCVSLTDIFCAPRTPPILGMLVFFNSSSLGRIYVPNDSVDAYKTADGWKDHADKIVGHIF